MNILLQLLHMDMDNLINWYAATLTYQLTDNDKRLVNTIEQNDE